MSSFTNLLSSSRFLNFATINIHLLEISTIRDQFDAIYKQDTIKI